VGAVRFAKLLFPTTIPQQVQMSRALRRAEHRIEPNPASRSGKQASDSDYQARRKSMTGRPRRPDIVF
jgi:hypothetical protein